MRMNRHFTIRFMVFFIMIFALTQPIRAAEKEYKVGPGELEKHKAAFDDPRPYLKDLSYSKILPPDVYKKLTYDVEAMKAAWAEVVGFKASDVVGKIAPEIKPGKYTYKDKEKYPGLEELMLPSLYKRFAPGAPPHAGNFPEMTIVPTNQYYWALPICEATKKNMGKTKLDEEGYIINETYEGGYPFPQPSGKHKAQQIIYNWVKRYYNGENFFAVSQMRGFNKNLKIDFDGLAQQQGIRLEGRVISEPYGWYDKRAQELGEGKAIVMKFLAPRDLFGMANSLTYYIDPNKFDQSLIYINVLRRVRKMSTTDTQDAVGGQDVIYDDNDGFSQKLTPKLHPYKFEVVAEREYLVRAPELDGSLYMSSKGLELHNVRLERRPIYVIKLTQLDKNYVYSKRIIYVDKETFVFYSVENFDQKGRLYRDGDIGSSFVPEMGMFFQCLFLARDHVDLHSSLGQLFFTPALWVGRDYVDLRALTIQGK